LGVPGMDGRILSRRIIMKWGIKMLTGFNWLRINPIKIQKDASCLKIVLPKLHVPQGMRPTVPRSTSGLSRLKETKSFSLKISTGFTILKVPHTNKCG
jgi:hypothetical protein